MNRTWTAKLYFLLGALSIVVCGCTVFSTSNNTLSSGIGPYNLALKFDDGSTDSVDVTTATACPLDLTIEAWVKLDSMPSGLVGEIFYQDYGGAMIDLNVDNTGFLNVTYGIAGCAGAITPATSTVPLSVGQKYHVAFVSDSGGGITRFFINGAAAGTSLTPVATAGCAAGATSFGSQSGAIPFPGTIDEFRFSSSARYSGPFTPPSAPFTSDGSTVLLFHADDNTTSGSLTTGGTFTFTGTPTYVTSPFP